MRNNVPKLRFKGFSDEWKNKKIGEICTIHGRIGFRGYTTNDIVDKSEGVISLSPSNIVNSKLFIDKDNTYISLEKYNESPEIMIFKNDIIFVKTGSTLGKVALIEDLNEKATINPQLIVLKNIKISPKILCELIDSDKIKEQVLKSKGGGSIPTLTQKEFSEYSISYPEDIEEQEKIANFLTKIDKIIEKQEKKVSNIENYKKGMMQKIFSQEIRFKDENGNGYPKWEKKTLGSYVERVVRKNKNNITKRPLTISAQYGLVDQIEFFNKVVASANLEGYYLLNKGEFAYNKSYSNGYPFGAIKRLDRYDNGAVSTLYICFSIKESINSDFLVQYFESDKWHKEVSMIAVEGARNHGLLNISVTDFFDTVHKIPCLEEQSKIADFLSKIDSIVEKEKEKLEELRLWKKGLLQQMFV